MAALIFRSSVIHSLLHTWCCCTHSFTHSLSCIYVMAVRLTCSITHSLLQLHDGCHTPSFTVALTWWLSHSLIHLITVAITWWLSHSLNDCCAHLFSHSLTVAFTWWLSHSLLHLHDGNGCGIHSFTYSLLHLHDGCRIHSMVVALTCSVTHSQLHLHDGCHTHSFTHVYMMAVTLTCSASHSL